MAVEIEVTYPGFMPDDVKGIIDIPQPVDAGKPTVRRANYTLPRRAVPPVFNTEVPNKNLIVLYCTVWHSVAAHGSAVIAL